MPYGNNIFGIGLDYTNELNSRTVRVYDVERKELIATSDIEEGILEQVKIEA